MNDYERKQEERRERYLDRASDADRESRAGFERANAIADMIPMGQPILVGHSSEKRHRRDLDRIDRGMRAGIDAQEKADYYRGKAASVGKGGVSSDDPDAVEKLQERVAELEAQQARMKAVNKAHAAFVKNPASLDSSDLSDADKAAVRAYVPQYSWEPHPYAPYQFQNLGGNLRRIKQRIEQLAKDAGRETKMWHLDDLSVCQNAEANRVQIVFMDKPDEAVRTELKRRGFRWSPMESAWQRHLNGSGIYAAESFVKWYQERNGASHDDTSGPTSGA